MIKRKTYGIGYNTGGKHKTNEHGKRLRMYQVWRDMLKRCYAKDSHIKNPSYIGCTVDERWYNYQNFAEWYVNHPYCDMDYQLDKDILFKGNRVYSPETCCLVPNEINSILHNPHRPKNSLPQGVCWDKDKNRYKVQMNMNGRYRYLGSFKCPNKASDTYKTAKEAYVKERAIAWRDCIALDVYEALMDWELN